MRVSSLLICFHRADIAAQPLRPLDASLVIGQGLTFGIEAVVGIDHIDRVAGGSWKACMSVSTIVLERPKVELLGGDIDPIGDRIESTRVSSALDVAGTRRLTIEGPIAVTHDQTISNREHFRVAQGD